jgi:hypothetical protein
MVDVQLQNEGFVVNNEDDAGFRHAPRIQILPPGSILPLTGHNTFRSIRAHRAAPDVSLTKSVSFLRA